MLRVYSLPASKFVGMLGIVGLSAGKSIHVGGIKAEGQYVVNSDDVNPIIYCRLRSSCMRKFLILYCHDEKVISHSYG